MVIVRRTSARRNAGSARSIDIGDGMVTDFEARSGRLMAQKLVAADESFGQPPA